MPSWDLITDEELQSMKEELENIPNIRNIESRVCAFIGGRCDIVSLVDVPVLAERQKIVSHKDLDVFLWMPGVPYMTLHFTNVNAHRVFVRHTPAPGTETFIYVFVCYDQKIVYTWSASSNYLVDKLVGGVVNWYGEIMVVKTSESGTVLNFSRDDLGLLPSFLRKFVGPVDKWINRDT